MTRFLAAWLPYLYLIAAAMPVGDYLMQDYARGIPRKEFAFALGLLVCLVRLAVKR